MSLNSDSEVAGSPIRPAGRAAARMLQEHRDSSSPAKINNDVNASYEQFKKSLPWMQDDDDGSQSFSDNHADSPPPTDHRQRQTEVTRAPTPPVAPQGTPTDLPSSPTIQASRASSPGLFVSSREASPEVVASAQNGASNSNSDSDLPTANTLSEALFQEKVAQKRAERKARESQSHNKKEERRRKLEALSARMRKELDEGEESESSPDDAEKAADSRLTQETTRPNARKASRRAREEMSKEIRENQRFNRSLQLTHQAKTKRKITKDDLFKAFNFRQPKQDLPQPQAPPEQESSVPTSSDVEMVNGHDTPPTSPAVHEEQTPKNFMMSGALASGTTPAELDPSHDEDDLPDLQVLLAQPIPKMDKGKGRARTPEARLNGDVLHAQIRPTEPKTVSAMDSDDDLEIVTKTPSRFPVFDRMPAKKNQESNSFLSLRMLAHLTSPGQSRNKSSNRPTLNASEMQHNLIRRGRQQAKAALMEKIEQEKVAGTYISPEELQKQQEERENDLEKLRKDVEELGKRERKTARDNGEVDESQMLPSDDEDEAYIGSESDAGDMGDDEDEDIELSGSEDEESETDGIENDGRALFDDEAGEDDATDNLPAADNNTLDASDNDGPAPTRAKVVHRSRKVIQDDDEESEGERHITSMPTQTQSTANNNVAAAFGFGQPGSSPALGLTQMFAGTMASASQTQPNTTQDQNNQTISLEYFRQLAMSTAPDFDASMIDDSQDVVVQNSQTAFSQHELSQPQQYSIRLGVSQFPGPGDAEYSQSQLSDLPDPTQDAGFQMRTPAGMQKAPQSTTETIRIHDRETPVPMKKFRLHRRSGASPSLSDIDDIGVLHDANSDPKGSVPPAVDAFNVLKKASKKKAARDLFNKKKSEAKTMFEEQAEESEDEYAGLGGASEDESGGEMDEETAKMLDHGKVDLKEGELAAFHAEDERIRDEKDVQKLHKDIINGGLRRKRAANDDLLGAADDEWDEEAERRRRKQLDFRRAYDSMMKDGKLQKLNTDKTKAFLRAVQDADEDLDIDFYDNAQDLNSIPDSQEPSNSEGVQAEAETTQTTNPLKRAAEFGNDENRAPPNLRRTAPTGNRPPPRPFIDQFDLRASLSNLLDEPDRIPDSQHDPASDSEGNEASPSFSRSHGSGTTGTTTKAVIDRLALSRSASNAAATPESGSTHLAFHAPIKSGTGAGFRVPSLIRRVTSGMSATTSTSSSGASTPVAEASGVRMGGSNKSNIHYQAREAERKRVLDASEERRKGELKKKVRANKGQGGLRGVLGEVDGWS